MKNNYTTLRVDRIFPKLRVAFSTLVLLMFAATTAFAQNIWNDPITAANPNSTNPYNLNAASGGASKNANIDVSGISRSNGIAVSPSNLENVYNAVNWAQLENRYFEFTLTPKSGYQINLLAFIYTGQRHNSSAPKHFALRSSLDGFTADIGSIASEESSTAAILTTVNLSGAAYQNIFSTPITFRLYAWGGTATTTGQFSVNDFKFTGTVTPYFAGALWQNPLVRNGINTSPHTGGDLHNSLITVSGISRGSGISLAPTTNITPAYIIDTTRNSRYNAFGWNGTSVGTAISNGDYFQFTLTPTAEWAMNFIKFTFTGKRDNAGSPTDFAVRSSKDGFSTDIATFDITDTDLAVREIDLSATAFQNIYAPITFRIYGWGGESANTDRFSVNDFVFEGGVQLTNIFALWNDPITGTYPSNTNPFNPNAANTGDASGAVKHSNIGVSGITRGSGINQHIGTPLENRFAARDWTTTGNAVNNNDYFEFTLTPNSGYKFDTLSAFSFTGQRNENGPQYFVLRSSLNSYGSNIGDTLEILGTSPSYINIALPAEDFNSLSFNYGQAVTFRLYGWGAVNVSGAFAVNDFSFYGKIDPPCAAPVQESLTVTPAPYAALVGWGSATPSTYQYAVTTSSAAPTSSTPPVLGTPTTNTSTIVNGLSAATQYYLHVRNVCSTERSAWVNLSFETLEAPPAVANDNPANTNQSFSGATHTYPACNAIQGTTTGATSMVNSYTEGARDVWYRFTALPGTHAATIKVTSEDFAPQIHLFTWDFQPLDVETVTSNGEAIMNYYNLTGNVQYRIAVSSQSIDDGDFDICVRFLRHPSCNTAAVPNLCANRNFSSYGPATTTLTFKRIDDNSNTQTSLVIPQGGGSTYGMGNPQLNLMYDATYDIKIDAYYPLTDAAGNLEPITLSNLAVQTMTIPAHHPIVVREDQRCTGDPATGTLFNRNSGILYGKGDPANLCTSKGYNVKFTRVDNCNGEDIDEDDTFTKTINSSTASINMSAVFNDYYSGPGYTQIGYWQVEWQPIFTGGVEGNWGTPYMIRVKNTTQEGDIGPGPASMSTASGSAFSSSLTVSGGIDANLYPNPNNGEMVNLNMTGLTNEDVYVRILDGMGRVVYTERFIAEGSLNTVVAFSKPLAAGLYMVEFTNGNDIVVQRMMVTK